MDLAELNRILRRAGLDPLAYGPDGRRWQTLTPTSITTELDRGHREVEEFRDEDALCRHLLVRELVHEPPRRGARLQAVADAVVAPHAGAGLLERWHRPTGSHDGVLTRGRGLVALLDTAPIVDDPHHGAAQVTVVDVSSGQALWTSLHGGAAVRHHLVGSAHDPLLLTLAGQRLEAFGARDGALRWSREVVAGAEVAAEADGTVVLRSHDGTALGLDLADGSQRWTTTGLLSTVYTGRGVPVLPRFFAITGDDRATRIDCVDLVSGVRSLLVETNLGDETGADLLLVVDEMDESGHDGYVVVRLRPGYGAPMRDVVVRRGSVQPYSPPEGAPSFLAESFAPDRLLRQATYPDAAPTVLESSAGEELWSREGSVRLRGRSGDVSVIDTNRTTDRRGRRLWQVEAVADDGASRWCEPGLARLVDHDDVWVELEGVVTVLGVRDGLDKGQFVVPWGPSTLVDLPNRLRGWHPDDRHVLLDLDGALRAYALR